MVVSGPSGVGKDTLIQRLLEVDPNLRYSVSYTTRASRPGEVEGVDYRFVTREQFGRLVQEGALLEHATYDGNLYGTPSAPVEEARAAGQDILLKIEVQGAEQVRRRARQGLFIFISPPSMEELARRQKLRSSETAEEMEARGRIAKEELAYAPRYDHMVINDDLERAVAEVLAIIRNARGRQT